MGEYVKDVDSEELRTEIVAADPMQRPALKRQETGDYESCAFEQNGSKKLWLGCRMTDEIKSLITGKAPTARPLQQRPLQLKLAEQAAQLPPNLLPQLGQQN